MGRPLRFIPPCSVVEVTARTVGSRFLLRPGPTTNELVLGVLGRAQKLYGVQLFAIAVMSNHMHALVSVEHAAQLAAFMQHLLANIAKEVGPHHGWSGPFWSRRYRSVVVADAESQVARIRYVLGQGLKEGLVDRADRWPGVSSFRASTRGTPLQGTWYDRTAQSKARRRAEKPDPSKTERVYQVQLSQLPAMADTPPEEYRKFIQELVRCEERDVAADRAQAGKTSALGARRILKQDPHEAPTDSERSPAPMVHATTAKVRAAFREAYTAFVDAFRFAAQCLRSGQSAIFPASAFPPSAPFVKPEPVAA